MKIAICDDNSIFRKEVKQEIESYFQSLDVLLYDFSSGEELLSKIENIEFDLFFLDIEMAGIDGLETAKKIREREKEVPVILLTSHTELAMEGYEVQAFRFLGKPLNRQKLYDALDTIMSQIHSDEKIAVMVDGSQKFISCQNIMYIKSENVYLNLVTKDATYLIRQKMKEQIAQLPEELFFSVHRSYVVNLMFVDGFDGKEVKMSDGAGIPVARGNRDLFKQRIRRYLKEK